MDGNGIRPCIEVEPSKFIVVVGPRVAESVLCDAVTTKDAKLPALSLTAMVSEGISVLLDSKNFQKETERLECEKVYRNAFQMDPLPKLLSNLQHCGGYGAWLERCFQLKVDASKVSPTLERLLELQDEGALLVYTGCDDVLSRLGSQRVLLPAEDFASWVKGEKKGFLNVHGVYWKPETLQLQCEAYIDPNHPSRMAMSHLEQLFQQRSVITIGTCDPTDLANPMLAAFARSFLFTASSNVTSRQYRFHLSMDHLSLSGGGARECSNRCLLNLPQFRSAHKDQEKMGWTIVALRGQARMLYEELDLPAGGLADHHMLSLLVKSKRGASEVSKMTFDSPGANFALVSSVSTGMEQLSHTVTIRVEAAKLAEFWDWLWVEKRDALIREGLLAVIMQTGAILWCQANLEVGQDSGVAVGDIPIESPQELKYSQQLKDVASGGSGGVATGGVTPMEVQHKHEVEGLPPYKNVSPLVTQEFPMPKPGGKVIPRYTLQRFKTNGGRNSYTLPANVHSSAAHHSSYLQAHSKSLVGGASDDIGVHGESLPKQDHRRSSLPQQLSSHSSGGSDSKLFTLAENCHSPPSVSERCPPSYVAIKQALLCDQYKRRQSVQSDPKTLKNLLKTKLVISEDSNDLMYMRRKSDPGSYVKQRDFERRKELFLDENLSWSKSYGKVIDQQITKWQQKRQEKQLQREMNWREAQAAAAASASLTQQLQLHMLNHPLLTGQPVQLADGSITTMNTAAVAASFLQGSLAPGSATGMVNPYMIPPTLLPTSVGATSATPPLYYSPLGSPYTLLNPYAATASGSLQLGQVQPTPTPPPTGAFFLPAQQPKVLYYLSTSNANSSSSLSSSSSSSSLSSSSTAANTYSFPIHTTQQTSPSAATLSSADTNPGTNMAPASTSSPPRISLIAPPTIPNTTTWLTDNTQFGSDLHKLQPVSPNSRKRHQSVPEKLTTLLQPPPLPSIPPAPPSTSSLSSGRSSPMDEGMEGNPDSPPLSKKQRSTSDTTVYHSTYRSHHSPGGGRSPTPLSQGNSPQPPLGGSAMAAASQGSGGSSLLEGGLSPLQAHLLQVHQSYGISRSAVEERKRRHKVSRDKRGHSPLRKHSGGSLSNGRKLSGGSVTNGSMSPTSSLLEEGQIMEGVPNMLGSVLMEGRGREIMSDMEEREGGSETGSEQGSCNDISSNSCPQLWQFLLDLLLMSSNNRLIHWTDNEVEFRISRPVEVAQLWGQFTNAPGFNYEQLLTKVTGYFKEGILSQVQDRKLTFKFDGQVKDYARMRRLQMANMHTEDDGELVVVVE